MQSIIRLGSTVSIVFLGGSVVREGDGLQIELSLDPCGGRGSARIAFNLANTSTRALVNAIAMFREFLNSIEYMVDNLSLNVDRSSVEIVLDFISKQQSVKRSSASSRLKFIAVTSDEGDR